MAQRRQVTTPELIGPLSQKEIEQFLEDHQLAILHLLEVQPKIVETINFLVDQILRHRLGEFEKRPRAKELVARIADLEGATQYLLGVVKSELIHKQRKPGNYL